MVPFEHLGPYRVGSAIGRGGMGSVYKATHEKTGEVVAVKVIAESVSDDMRFRRRFAVEVETLKKLRHPNIVSLIGQGEQGGRLFYSMEFVAGETLQDRLRREKRLSWQAVLDLGIDVCNALKHAHNFGVIHRDLKPANLMFGTDGVPKLLDFGIVKLFGSAEQTAAGAVLGTADYMAPEQASDGPISPRTDLYALGNVLYACLAGRPPFGGRSMTKIIESLKRDRPVSLDVIAPDVPEEIVQLINDLLEKAPDDRPPTALAVMNRMKAIRVGLERQKTTNDATKLTGIRKVDSPAEESSQDATHSDDVTRVIKQTPQEQTLLSKELRKNNAELSHHDLTIEASAVDLSASDVLAAGNNLADDDLALTGISVKSAVVSPISSHATKQTQVEPVESSTSTHFTTVDEERRTKSIKGHDELEGESTLWQYLSIAAMVGVLVGAAGLFFWATRRPIADDLYAKILLAQDSDDTTTARATADQFKRLYPNDSRIDDLQVIAQELDSSRVMRRLRLASVREGGDDHLEAHEQSFLEAMRDIDLDPEKSLRMLRHWLNVYDPSGRGAAFAPSSELTFMVRAARDQVRRLSAQPIQPGDARADALIARIRAAEKKLDAKAFQGMMEGIVALYAEKPWASGLVELARERLKAISAKEKATD